ncbi:hypothetical protein QZM25_28350 [Burkholderia contaminans]|uniref:hypothetical protein n=1 Tax=Burkholderia cepacia complex TaxID=87882 RepID=UPI001CF5A1E3|nr:MULTISPECIES: hypothetical protein [Burkholderia cepacia complex]MCA7888845.1 hypothetical protein [Burkholderia contaminans]MDN7576529.1 hypothetical protein [Burkholderia contaminans]MDN7670679.1 hypothetical protein [Burkholderia vietnamiensis]
MGNIEERESLPTYHEVVTAPRQSRIWPPFEQAGRRTRFEVGVANAAVVVAFAVMVGMILGIYAVALWATDGARDAFIEVMPGSVNYADLISLALTCFETMLSAWTLKMLWNCVPYVIGKLRQSADQIF